MSNKYTSIIIIIISVSWKFAYNDTRIEIGKTNKNKNMTLDKIIDTAFHFKSQLTRA